MASKGGNLQLMLGVQNRPKAPKKFLVPQKLFFFGGGALQQNAYNVPTALRKCWGI